MEHGTHEASPIQSLCGNGYSFAEFFNNPRLLDRASAATQYFGVLRSGASLGVGIISRTAERNYCVSFRILQEYDNLRNGTAERTVIGRNGTLTQALCYNPNP